MSYLNSSLSLNGTMRAVMWSGIPYNVTIQNVPIPKIQDPTDAIISVKVAGICGTDLHTYRGILGSSTVPWVMGHEAAGVVVEIGSGVDYTKVGDEVVIPDQIHTGLLEMLLPNHGYSSGGFYGLGVDYGGFHGCQTEYVRVKHADMSLIPIPKTKTPNADGPSMIDYLFLGDIFSTGWTALQWSGFESGDTVVVFGGGPVGLLAAYSAKIRGASKIYLVDPHPARLALAQSMGAIPISLNDSISAVDQILALEPLGVTRSVDCVGYEALDQAMEPQQDAVLLAAIAVTTNRGGIGSIGVYKAQDVSAGVPKGKFDVPMKQWPMADFYTKGLSFRSGAVDPKLVAPHLAQLVSAGGVKPDFIVSKVIGIEDAPKYYERFNQKLETKVIIQF